MLQPAQLHIVRRVVVQARSRRARAGAEDEAEAVVEVNVVDQLHHLVEVVFRLAGEAHDEVAAHGQVGANGAQLAHRALVFHGGVAALHGHQNAVAAVLHGQVQVAGQLGQLGVGLDQPGREFVGVAGGVANAFDAGNVRHIFQQQRKVGNLGCAPHLAQVGVHVLAQQGDFLHALVGQARHFDQHIVKRAAHFFATGVGHHAVAAVFAAAFHDGHKGRSALHACGRQVVELFNLWEADVHLGLIQLLALVQHLGQAVQGLRAKHHVHIGGALDDFGAFLAGHAAAHANLHAACLQVLDAAQVAEDLFLRLLAHRAGVEKDEVGLIHVLGGLVALRGVQHVGHLVRVVLVHLAAEGFDKDFFGHGNFTNSKQTPLPTGRGD